MSGLLDCDLPGEGDRILDRLFMKVAMSLRTQGKALINHLFAGCATKLLLLWGRLNNESTYCWYFFGCIFDYS